MFIPLDAVVRLCSFTELDTTTAQFSSATLALIFGDHTVSTKYKIEVVRTLIFFGGSVQQLGTFVPSTSVAINFSWCFGDFFGVWGMYQLLPVPRPGDATSIFVVTNFGFAGRYGLPLYI